MTKPLNLFEFSDYRRFMREWIERSKETKTSNLTRLAEAIRVHPTFLSHVLAGTKDLSLEQATALSAEFSLTKLEREFFFILVQSEKAGTHELKEYWLERKKEILSEKDKLNRRFEKFKTFSENDRAVFFSSWIYSAVFAATAIQEGQTIDQISERTGLDRERVTQTLSFLIQTGVCMEKSGIYSMGEIHIHISNESPFVVKHHSNWRMKAIQKMDLRDAKELFFTSPMSISKRDFDVIREKLNQAVQNIVEVATHSSAEELVCLNIDFFRFMK